MLSGYTRYIPNVKVTCITMSRLHWYLCCGLDGCSILQQKFNDLDSVLLAGNMKWGESILKQQTLLFIWSAHFNILSSLETFQVDNNSYLITLTQLQLRYSIKSTQKIYTIYICDQFNVQSFISRAIAKGIYDMVMMLLHVTWPSTHQGPRVRVTLPVQ